MLHIYIIRDGQNIASAIPIPNILFCNIANTVLSDVLHIDWTVIIHFRYLSYLSYQNPVIYRRCSKYGNIQTSAKYSNGDTAISIYYFVVLPILLSDVLYIGQPVKIYFRYLIHSYKIPLHISAMLWRWAILIFNLMYCCIILKFAIPIFIQFSMRNSIIYYPRLLFSLVKLSFIIYILNYRAV